MPTLYVRDVPRDLYDALRRRAKDNGRTIRAEVIALLQQFYLTEKEPEGQRRVLLNALVRVPKPIQESDR